MVEDDSEYERNILANVEEHGWFCTSVFDPDGDAPSFSYSVGFTKTLDSPEFIVFGLPAKLMHSMLWKVFRLIKAGKQPEDHQRWSDLLEGFDCISRVVHPTNIVRDYLNSAMWLWRTQLGHDEPLQAFQLVWPSSETGLFPWDADCAQIVRDYQPPLWLPNRSLS
jgi:hypothetical protein